MKEFSLVHTLCRFVVYVDLCLITQSQSCLYNLVLSHNFSYRTAVLLLLSYGLFLNVAFSDYLTPKYATLDAK